MRRGLRRKRRVQKQVKGGGEVKGMGGWEREVKVGEFHRSWGR
jgi:hypothetical protein